MNRSIFLILGCIFGVTCNTALGQGHAEATYNPLTGRMTIRVVNANSWVIESLDGQLTGPDDVMLSGVLPAVENSLVTNSDFLIGEGNFVEFSYGPLDLGLVAQPQIPANRLLLRCACPLGATEMEFPIVFAPETDSTLMSLIACTAAVCLQRCHRKSSPYLSRGPSRSDDPTSHSPEP